MKSAVVSPGSRNAPLLADLCADASPINCLTVVDERTAAFYGLGMALQGGEPVALVCTSGTAPLNYAPALAEAYYRHVPLIAVTADRPLQWIDQDDSQTIRQPGSLANFVKATVDISADWSLTPDGRWLANRQINDALLTALRPPQGPVHINIRIGNSTDISSSRHLDISQPRVIRELRPEGEWKMADIRALVDMLPRPLKILLVAGFSAPDHRLSRAIGRLASLPGVAVMTETIANIHAEGTLSRIDTLLASMTADEKSEMKPDLVITTGGALVSRKVKQWLRDMPVNHWHIGPTLTTVDCFRQLTLRVEGSRPSSFLSQLATMLSRQKDVSDYNARWQSYNKRAIERHESLIEQAPWSDLRLFSLIAPRVPRSWGVHLSNGTPIRYAQLMDCSRWQRCECNRGVSGIDGATSTAVGAAIAYKGGDTLLITGDLSAAYDLGALTTGRVPSSFRMLVVNNSGGDIFRFVGSTRNMPIREERLSVADNQLLLRPIALANGWTYLHASDEQQFLKAWSRFTKSLGPAILEVATPKDINSRILSDYLDPSPYHLITL